MTPVHLWMIYIRHSC